MDIADVDSLLLKKVLVQSGLQFFKVKNADTSSFSHIKSFSSLITSKRYRIENDNLQSREHNQVIFDTIQNPIVVGNLEISVKLLTLSCLKHTKL